MAVGLRVRDPVTGQILIDLATHLTKILGTFNTGTTDGSITDANLAKGTPFFATAPSSSASSGTAPPTITITASGLSWTWVGNPPSYLRSSMDVTYGFWT